MQYQHKRYNLAGIFLVVLFMFMWTACMAPTPPAQETEPITSAQDSPASTAPETNLTDGCIERFDPDVDYFPDKAVLTHTEGFTVEYFPHYKVITVKTPWPGAQEAMHYVLVQCGAPAPEGFADEQIIEVPLNSIVTMSTSYLPFLDDLGLLDRLVGIDDITYVNNETVTQMVNEGKLAQIGYGSGVNVEQVLDLQPDLIMTYGSGTPEYDAHPVLRNAGLKVVVNAEWTDTSPLGRAEWGKFIALFFNREADAEEIFTQVVQRYEDLAARAATATTKPTVFTDTEFQGTWYLPGGQGYGARYLADAGADYLWAEDTSVGSIPLSFEAVFDRAADADFWINLGFINSMAELEAADARYADFAAFQNGKVWNNNRRVNGNGGSDFYESAVAHPDDVLADLIAIFHPDLMPDHEFVYYQKLE